MWMISKFIPPFVEKLLLTQYLTSHVHQQEKGRERSGRVSSLIPAFEWPFIFASHRYSYGTFFFQLSYSIEREKVITYINIYHRESYHSLHRWEDPI